MLGEGPLDPNSLDHRPQVGAGINRAVGGLGGQASRFARTPSCRSFPSDLPLRMPVVGLPSASRPAFRYQNVCTHPAPSTGAFALSLTSGPSVGRKRGNSSCHKPCPSATVSCWSTSALGKCRRKTAFPLFAKGGPVGLRGLKHQLGRQVTLPKHLRVGFPGKMCTLSGLSPTLCAGRCPRRAGCP